LSARVHSFEFDSNVVFTSPKTSWGSPSIKALVNRPVPTKCDALGFQNVNAMQMAKGMKEYSCKLKWLPVVLG